MDKVLTVLQVVAPIFFAVFLGICAKKRSVLSFAEIEGMQRFVIKFCVPCLIFRSCLTADITPQALSSMLLLPPFQLLGIAWSFSLRKKRFAYHNLPFLFVCKETGMMGIPLFMILFGADQAYRMGVLDVAQAMLAFLVIGILSAEPGKEASGKTVIKQMVTSPMIILSILGMILNITGIWDSVMACGIGGIVIETISFLSEPVSAVMLFCVGYNFALDKDSRTQVFQITALHVAGFALAGLLVQGALLMMPGVDALTRWAAILYFLLPASYLTPGLGKSQEDFTVASGVCSLTTILCLIAFCVMAVLTA